MKNLMFLTLVLLLVACQVSDVAVDDIDRAPSVTEEDKENADVFKPLEGKWIGEFKVFKDLRPSERNMDILTHPTTGYLRTPSMTLQKRAKVERTYTSDSPYFQRVDVRETYYDEQGEMLEVLNYKGVQKTQKGNLWSVMQIKKDSLVVLNGKQIRGGGLTWQQASSKPKIEEYFELSTRDDLYEVLGFGYYEGDDKRKMPRFWYYGRYEKQ